MNGKFIDRNDNLTKNNMGGTEETSRGPIGNFGAGNLLLVDNMVRQQQQQQQSGATIVSKVSAVIDAQPRRRSHPHVCLCGTLHLVNGMWLLIGIGIFMFAALCIAEVLYFRRALFVMAIPGVVLILSTVAVGKREPRFLWPIIGISFFHLFLDAYLTLIFLFFFLFKPLYIIMVLNWAFDTLHTSKTPSYYAHCAVIFTILIVFFLSNLWQLHTSLRFQTYLEELLGSGSSATASTGGSGESSSSASNDGSVMKCGGKMGVNGQNHHAHQHQFRVLNEPPILLFGDGITASSGNQQRMLLCPSPASQRAGGPHNLRSSGMGPRRPSLSEIRQFSTR